MKWLGFDWGKTDLYASRLLRQLYEFAEALIQAGHAYVDSQSAEEMRAARGTLTEPGKDQPWRNRTVEENLALFRGMRDGKYPDGAHVLRAKIDMGSPNINLRDPVIYRIRHAHHHRTGDKWCIYPLYDYAHGLSGRAREHHALAVHAGVRGPPAALRLVQSSARRGRPAARAAPAAADRVRAAQSHLRRAFASDS